MIPRGSAGLKKTTYGYSRPTKLAFLDLQDVKVVIVDVEIFIRIDDIAANDVGRDAVVVIAAATAVRVIAATDRR